MLEWRCNYFSFLQLVLNNNSQECQFSFALGGHHHRRQRLGAVPLPYRAVGTEGGRASICPAPLIFGRSVTPLSQPWRGRLYPPHYYVPPPDFQTLWQPCIPLHCWSYRITIDTIEKLCGALRLDARVPRKNCAAPADQYVLLAMTIVGSFKNYLDRFLTFFDQLPPNLYVHIFKGGYTSKRILICFPFPNERKIVCTQTIWRIVFKCMKMGRKSKLFLIFCTFNPKHWQENCRPPFLSR